MKARIAITVDRPMLDVFESLASVLAKPPALEVQPDSFNLEDRKANELVAVVAESGGHKVVVRYGFAAAALGTAIDCAYEVTSRSMLASLGIGADSAKLLGAWMQQDMQRIPSALQDMVKAEAEHDRSAQPAPVPTSSASEPRRITRRLDIKMKAQIPPGVKLDPSRVDPNPIA